MKFLIRCWLYFLPNSTENCKKIRNIIYHLEKVQRNRRTSLTGTDRKCVNCKTWENQLEQGWIDEQVKEGVYKTSCPKCGHTSYWNYIAAPLPLLCDEEGTPL